MLLISLSVWITFRVIHALHVDVVPDNSITYDGKNIHSGNLHAFLEKHEQELIFGKDTQDIPHFTLAKLNFNRRSKRSLNNRIKSLSLRLENEETGQHDIHINLRPSTRLIDDAFVYIKRFENSSILIDDFHRLAEQYANCFYRSGGSAIDVCDDAMHGVIKQRNKSYTIHPLPERFGKSAHVIVETIATSEPSALKRRSPSAPTRSDRMGCPSEQDAEASNLNENESTAANYRTGTGSSNNNNIIMETRGQYRTLGQRNARAKRFISGTNKVPHVLHIETAIFVDKDLYRHMSKNYPKDTESRLMRFVLAMINGVQLLYHHPSLGHEINFVLKRLEILHNDPKGLQRSSDIDIFLNSFCLWQRKFNPVSDADAVHFDHAVILTGLDLYVVGKNGKISSQVVGLAPVAGMCTATSSCTINEGKHFESVFVVAHEIGHNLGMRHDTSDNDCDPSLYIMSPTLGSGKITWSKCSRKYLDDFLGTHQSKCLFDRGHFGTSLDHTAEGLLPGQRFNADQQCLLKYGKNSVRSKTQEMSEICRDLHCQRDRYTWTSHPSLEGTQCGGEMWCRSGSCVSRNDSINMLSSAPAIHVANQKLTSNLAESARFTNLNNNNSPAMDDMDPVWSDWDAASQCESGCLFGESGRLREGSTGLRTITRTCLDNRSRKRCPGQDRKYEACSSKQCYNVPRTTVLDFTNQICDRARKFDKDILADGIQQIHASPYDACKVFCRTKGNSTKTKGWIYPDGTICRTTNSELDDTSYCVNGKCEKFTCDNTTVNLYRADAAFCQTYETVAATNLNIVEGSRDLKNMAMSEKLIDSTSIRGTVMDNSETRKPSIPSNNGFRANADIYERRRYKDFDIDTKYKARSNKWRVRSGCHFGCMEHSKGIQIVASKEDQSTNIQLCEPEVVACDVLQTVFEFANKLCYKYQLKVRGLSGNGMQILPSADDPDRGCKVACQDEQLRHRFYLVNGDQGYFPFGTKCSRTENRYCVNGKCLEFGLDNVPLRKSHISLAVYRNKRDVAGSRPKILNRTKRNYIYYSPVNITEHVDPEFLRTLIDQFTLNAFKEHPLQADHIDFLNPVHLEMDDYY